MTERDGAPERGGATRPDRAATGTSAAAPADPGTVDPVTAGSVTAGPVTVDPVTAGPVTVDPVTVDPVTAAPVTVDPVTAGPVTVDPVTAGPVTVDPVTAGPVTADPGTADPETDADARHASRPAGFTRAAVWSGVRLTITVTGLLLAYLLLPTRGQTGSSDVPWVILSLTVYAAVAGWQIPAILRSRWPMLRAIEALTIVIALFLLLFARLYLSNSLGDAAAFSMPLNHVRALYFTITVFATVGFGDITPQTDGLRILVSIQMLLNLVVLGLLLRLITGAVQRGRARRSRKQGRDGTSDDRAPAAGNRPGTS